MVEVSRRGFALGATAVGLAGVGFAQAQTQPAPVKPPATAKPLRIRKDVATLSRNDDNLVAFRDAFKIMSKGTGPLSWDRQVQVHAGMHNQHNSWLFLPWHRAQLNYFERIVAKVSGHADFALPYLNWDGDHIPELFFDRSDVFFHRRRRAFTAKDSISAFSQTGDAFGTRFRDLSRGEFDGFDDLFGRKVQGKLYGGEAEQFGHNLMHVFVGGDGGPTGGDMGLITTAPRDPLFFFHHSNVDRLWAQWSKEMAECTSCTTSNDPRYGKEWLTQSVSGYVDERGVVTAPVPVKTLLTTHGLGYAYDNIQMMVGASPPFRADATTPKDDVRSLVFTPTHGAAVSLTLPKSLVERRRKVFDKLDAPILIDLAGAPQSGLRAVISVHDGKADAPFAADRFFMVGLGHHNHNVGYAFQAKDLILQAADKTLAPRFVVWLERIDKADTTPIPAIAACRLAYASTEARSR